METCIACGQKIQWDTKLQQLFSYEGKTIEVGVSEISDYVTIKIIKPSSDLSHTTEKLRDIGYYVYGVRETQKEKLVWIKKW